MADFRKLLPVLAIVALLLGSAVMASAQPVTCLTNAGVPPVVRAEGLAELVGDVVMNCSGGNPANPFLVNWQIFLNTNVTSRLISGSSTLTEALMLVDEPAAPVLGTTGVTPGTGNTYRGTLAGNNSIVWLGIPFVPPGTTGATRTFRITNVRANANQLGVSSTLIPTQIVMFISASGSTSVAINNPQQTVAYIQTGLLFDVRACGGGGLSSSSPQNVFAQCSNQNNSIVTDQTASATGQFTVRFRENFATAFKKRVSGEYLGANASVPSTFLFVDPATGSRNMAFSVNPFSDAAGAGQVVASVPGSVYNTESGFTNIAVLGGETGFATQGTRLMARFNNIPAGIQIFVGTVNDPVNSSKGMRAALVSTDASGAGAIGTPGTLAAIVPITGTGTCSVSSFPIAPLTVSSGTATAVWEVLAADPFNSDTVLFPVFVAYTSNTASNLPGLGQANVVGTFAPISTVTTATNAPVPRFADTGSNAAVFKINACVTNLLFPFVTNQAGFDTGIAISNTSVDPFGTATQAGSCTVNYYGATSGGGAAPAAQQSAVVPAGGQLVFTLNAGGNLGLAATPGFQGYIIAQCAFQFAHGFAFVSDLGAQRLAEGYLALILDSGGINRTGVSSEVLSF